MKTIRLLLIFTLSCEVVFSQESILLNNSEHVIYYTINSEIISVGIEDLKDNEDNIRPYNVVKHGNADICGYKSPDYNALSDACGIEVDINQNQLFDENIDLGYMIADLMQYGYSFKTSPIDYNNPSKYINDKSVQTDAVPYFLKKKVNNDYTEFYTINKVKNFSSRVQGNVKWCGSKYKEFDHLIYNFEIPINEIVAKENGFAYLRFIILRVADYKFINNVYGTFYYPEQNCNNMDSIYTYKVDLSQTDMFKKISREELHLKNTSNLRSVYTQSEIKKSIINPEWEGVYIKTSNISKYIEVKSKFSFKYGGMFNPNSIFQKNLSNMGLDDWEAIENNPIYFFYAEEIDTNSRLLTIKSINFNGLFLNLASFDSKILERVTLRKYNPYVLKADGSEMFFPISKVNLGRVSNTYGFFLSRQKIYFAGDKVELKRASMPNGYMYTPAKIIEPGIYSFSYNNDYGYIFEITK